MRVICTETTVWSAGVPQEQLGTTSVRRGSIYHVTGSVDGEVLRKETNQPFAHGTWYQLLEIPGVHHSMRFLELPDDDFEEGIQEEQIAIEEELNK